MMSPIAVFVVFFSLTVLQGFTSPVPKELRLFADVSPEDDARLFPLGWSADGDKVAMLIAYSEQAADERRWEVRVLDLKARKAVFSEFYRVDAPLEIAGAWERIGDKIDAVCKTYGMVRGEAVLRPFPMFTGSHPPGQGPGRYQAVEAHLSIERGKDADLGSLGIRKMEAVVSVGDDRDQVVGTEAWDSWIPMAAGIVGAIPNPKGNGMVVVVSVVRRGFEGPPHVRDLYLYGALVE